MLGGELMFHFMNVMVLTFVVAPLVLWRYRRAVLAGMRHRLGAPLPVPAPRAAARGRARASPSPARSPGKRGSAGASSSARSPRCSFPRSCSPRSTSPSATCR